MFLTVSLYTDTDAEGFVKINNAHANGYTQENLNLHQGATYITLVKAINNVKLVASHETTGIRIDISPPDVSFLNLSYKDCSSLKEIDRQLHFARKI